MPKLMIVCGLLLLWAASARAQEGPGFEVSGTYQYVRFNPGSGASGINCQGGSGSFGAYFTSRVGVIGEFGGCKVTGLPSGTSAHELEALSPQVQQALLRQAIDSVLDIEAFNAELAREHDDAVYLAAVRQTCLASLGEDLAGLDD